MSDTPEIAGKEPPPKKKGAQNKISLFNRFTFPLSNCESMSDNTNVIQIGMLISATMMSDIERETMK